MKYHQPFGISDPNGAYINGNPSTGTMGSIPPAASIEYPQRELVNYISRSNLTPSDADLYQLSRSIQSGIVNYGADTGPVNGMVITPTQPIAAYALGQRFLIKVNFGNTSQVTINVSGLGPKALVHCDQTPIAAWELLSGQLIEIGYDGVSFQLLAGGAPGGIPMLTAVRDLYVNDSTGSDTLRDGTAAAISGVMTGPFKTMQKALATMTKYNLGGWDFKIHVADGSYNNTTPINLPLPNGAGTVWLIGNLGSPVSVPVTNTGIGSTFALITGGNYNIPGFSPAASLAGGGDGADCLSLSGGHLQMGNMDFRSCPGSHMMVSGTAYLFPSAAAVTIRGNAFSHIRTSEGGKGANGYPANCTVNILNPVTMSSFVQSDGMGYFHPIYAPSGITGAGNVTGLKFNVSGNSIINTFGGGTSYLPGSGAGITATGGQYL